MATATAAPVVTITVDGTTYRLGKLNLSQLKKYRELIFAKVADIPKRDPVQFMFDVVPIIADSIRAAGTDISEEWLEEHLDISTVYDCFHQVFEANGLVLVPATGDGASGETPVQSTAAD